MQRTACVWKQTSPLINKDECLSDKLPIFSCVCTNRPPPSLPRLALFLPAGERRSGKCGSSYRSDLSSHYLRACAAAAFAKRHYSMNKYALAPVCVSPQRFYHRSSRARSLCKLLSVKKAQGKRKKNREGWSWGGIEEALSKHLRSDKSISVFNRVEEMCGRCGARGWESAKHRVESVTERLSGRVATNEAQLNLIMLTHPKFHINIATQRPPRHPSRLFTFLRCWPQPGLLTWASVACELWAPCSLEEKNGINMEAAVSVSPWGWRPRNPNLGLWHTSEGLVPLAWACRATLVWRNLHDEEMYNYVLIFFVQVCFDLRAVFMCADMPLTWTGVCLDL